MPVNSREKGANGEREISKILKTKGFNTRRGQQFSGAGGDADVIGLDGIHMEVKRVEKLNIEKAMEQSIRDHKEGTIPTVFHRKNRKPWLVTMLLDDWIELYRRWIE
jgi:Holliday junction resolvase